MTNNEIWRDIPGFHIYQISNFGRVRNVETYRISILGRHNGRARVNLYYRGKAHLQYVHRLVAQAFLPDYEEGRAVRHIDGDFTNNHETNLEMGHAHRVLLDKDIRVQVLETGSKYPSISAAARAIGGQTSNVRRVLEGTLKHHKGFTFRYVKI